MDYDVIVLGGGAPGEHCVGDLVDGGLRVAVVEQRLVGGARVPLEVMRDTIQPFPTFSEIFVGALKALRAEIAR